MSFKFDWKFLPWKIGAYIRILAICWAHEQAFYRCSYHSRIICGEVALHAANILSLSSSLRSLLAYAVTRDNVELSTFRCSSITPTPPRFRWKPLLSGFYRVTCARPYYFSRELYLQVQQVFLPCYRLHIQPRISIVCDPILKVVIPAFECRTSTSK